METKRELKIYHKRGREELPSSLQIPEGFHNLIYSKHARERFEERHGEDPVYPRVLNIIKWKNVIEVYTEDDIHPAQLLVSLQYRKYTKIYLVIIPFANRTAFVKTLWFSKTTGRNEKEDFDNNRKYPLTPGECLRPEEG
jgi:hypothetical protein